MQQFPVWIDGELHGPGQGFISTDDLGFLLGLSVFDSLLYEDGCAYFFERHLARLEHDALGLGLELPLPNDPRVGVKAICEALSERDAIVRMTLTRGVPGRGPTLVIGARAVEPPPADGVRVALKQHGPSDVATLKTTNRLGYILAREEARAAGAWEAIFVSPWGDVSEGTISNLFAVIEGTVVTAPVQRGCLPGITRELVLEELRASELPHAVRRMAVTDLARASEVFLTNTSGRVIGVTQVDGERADLPGPRGPVAKELRARIQRREAAYRVKSAAERTKDVGSGS